MEPTEYSISVSREPRGPATEATAEAYQYLAIIRRAFKSESKTPDPKVKEALAYLHDKHESWNCTRFLLFALSVFEEATDDFVRRYDSFWATCGAISGEALSRYGQTHVDIRPAEINTRFSHSFNCAPWDIKEKIIRGFIEVAKQTKSRDESFWKTVHTFFESCQSSLRAGPESVRPALESLVKFWECLTDGFGTAPDVRQQLAKVAAPLLNLILEANLGWNSGISLWKDSLFNLKLPLSDPLKSEPQAARNDLIQVPLNEAAAVMATLCLDGGHRLHARLKGVQEHLMTYLHGLSKCGERAALPSLYDRATATFKFGPTHVATREIRVVDVCLRTYRGFMIEVDGLSVPHSYDGDIGLLDDDVDGRHIRSVDVFLGDPRETVRVDSADLKVLYPAGGQNAKPLEFLLTARVLRAWRISDNRSGWALLAPQSFGIPDSWRDYLRSLTQIVRAASA